MKDTTALERPIKREGREEALRDAAGWPRVPLKSVCEINPRRTPSLGRADDAPTSFVPMPAVDARSGTIAQRLERPFGEIKKGYTHFENGDVIFAKITPCMQNGKHAVCRDLRGGFGFGSTEFHVLRPGVDLLADYLHLFLRQSDLLDDAERFLTGAVGQQRLPEDYLQELSIPLPPLAEQERMAGRLTKQLAAVERARAAAQARLAAAECLPAAYLREVFEGPEASGDDAGQTELPSGWRRLSLDQLVRCLPGAWGEDRAFEGCISVTVVGTSHISNDGDLDPSNAPTRHLQPREHDAVAHTGDLLVVKSSVLTSR